MNRIYIIVFLLGLGAIFSSCKQNSNQVKKVVEYEQYLAEAPNLEYQVQMPNPMPETAVPLLILMHGYGSNDQDMASLAKSLDSRCMIVSVQAPHEIGFNKFSWYQFARSADGYNYSFDELESSRAGIMKVISVMQEKYKINDKKIMVGGFSQGGMMSLAVGLKHSDVVDGIMVLSGDLLKEVEEEIEGIELNAGLDIYMSHGRQDQVLSFAEAVKDIKVLKAKGLDVYELYYDGAHTITQENFNSLSNWLRAKIDLQ